MYKMNTLSRQIPLPAHPSQLSATNPIATTNPTRNSASLPTFVSRGQQASLEAQPTDSTQVRYYEKQPSQVRRFHILFKSDYHAWYIAYFSIRSLELQTK